MSAGALCWFDYWFAINRPNRKPYSKFEALWFVKGVCCPHFDSKPISKKTLEVLVEKYQLPWYGIPDWSALYIENDVVQLLEWESKIDVYTVN